MARVAFWFVALTMPPLFGIAATSDAVATAPPSPAPSASPATSDPCGGYGRLLETLNRPTIGFSTCVPPIDTAILEEGYQLTVEGGGVAATYPVGFQRFGALPNLEIDLIGPNQNRASGGPTVQNGLSDLGVGFKYALSSQGPVHWAIDGLFTAATGSQAFTNGGPTAQLNIDASYSLTSNIGIAATVGVASSSGPFPNAADSFGRYGAVVPSFVTTYTPSRSSQVYAEYAARTKIGPDMGGDSVIDYGIQQLLGPNVEIDTEFGTDLTPIGGSRFHYFGVGLGLFLK